MCFNMSIVKEIQAIQDEFRAEFEEHPLLEGGMLKTYQASGFSHPQWPILASDSTSVISLRRWGLIPHWIKDSASARDIRAKTLNARGETIGKLPSFRYSYPRKTCLVIAEGFFEPHRIGKKSYPFFIHGQENTLLTLGGLYADWTNPDTGKTHRTFTIITVPAIGLVDKIHNHKHRMPLIIPENKREAWLDQSAPAEDRDSMITPWEPESLAAHPVSPMIYSRTGETNVPESRAPFTYGIPEVDTLAG